MRWIISLLDFRLWNGAGQGGGGDGGGQGGGGDGGGAGQGGGGTGGGPDQGGGGEGGYGWQRQRRQERMDFPRPAPTPAPAPATPEPNPPAAKLPETATHAQYARHLEDVRQRNRGAATMPAYAQDYELPDAAFGTRLY